MHLVGGFVHGASDIVGLESVNGGNILGGEDEVKALKVALDAVGSQRLGEDDVATSSVPVEEDLGRSLAVLLGNLANSGVLKLVAAGEGRVSLNLDAVLVAQVDESLALAEWVDLNLVDGGDNVRVLDEVLDVGSTEVGDANRLDLAKLLGNLKSAPRFETLLLIFGRGVDQVEVEVVKTELVEGGAEGVEGSLVAVVGVPELGADEYILAGGAGLLEPGADGATASLLIGITSGGVDVAVAGVKGSGDSVLSLLAVGGLVDTEGDGGDGVAVVELDGVDRRNGAAVGAVGLDLLDDHGALGGDLRGDSNGSHFERCVDWLKLFVCGSREKQRLVKVL